MWGPCVGISGLTKRRDTASFSLTREGTAGRGESTSQGVNSPDTESSGPFILDFQPPEV